jgi:hypothetical protein
MQKKSLCCVTMLCDSDHGLKGAPCRKYETVPQCIGAARVADISRAMSAVIFLPFDHKKWL